MGEDQLDCGADSFQFGGGQKVGDWEVLESMKRSHKMSSGILKELKYPGFFIREKS